MIGNRFVLVAGGEQAGGIADIRKAVDIHHGGQPVAIKLLREAEKDVTLLTFFEREKDSLQALDHPNIIRLVDAGWDEGIGRFYVALEWAAGGTLAERIADHGPYAWQEFFARVGVPLADALAHAHLKQVEHRDLKPQNVLLSSDGTPKLADFNIAKLRDQLAGDEAAGLTVAHYRSDLYAPPERTTAIPFTRDIWSFGVLAIHAMSAERARDFPDLVPLLEALDLPEEIRRLLRRCIAMDPHARPQNGAILHAHLEAALQEVGGRAARRTNLVWLKMTASAARGLLAAGQGERPDIEQAEGAMLNDLAGEVFAEFGTDHGSGLPQYDTVTLAGGQYRYKLVRDSREANSVRMVVVTATPIRPEWLARARERACPMRSKVTFSFGQRCPEGAELGYDTLFESLDAHEEARQNAALARDFGDLLNDWQRILEAREQLERGEIQPVAYRGRSINGQQVEFQAVQAVGLVVDGEEWEVRETGMDRPVARGDVVAHTPDSITLRFKRAPKDLPGSGRLTPHIGPSQVALGRQLDALRAVAWRESVSPVLRDVIERPEALPLSPPKEITTWFRADLDDSKKDVVRHAASGAGLVLVEGPPGTGKTTVIAEIIQQILDQAPATRILLVSQTHIAIDNALQRLEQAGLTNIVRLGRGIDDPRVAEPTRHLLLEQQMKQWARTIRKRADKHITALARQHGLEERHLRSAFALQELAVVLGDITHVQQRLTEATDHRAGTSSLTSAEPVDDVVDIESRLEELQAERDILIEQVRHLLGGDLTISTKPSQAEARNAVGAILGPSQDQQSLIDLMDLQAEWLHRVESDRGMLKAFLSSRSVVAGTAIGFLAQRAVRDVRFDLCIFDEASKATATETLVPMSRAKRWILVGDTRQLPPSDEDLLNNKQIMKDFSLTPELVSTTLFQHLANSVPNAATHLLREQYRMIKPIGDLISSCFYEDRLISPRTDQLPGYDGLGKPVLWINTEKLGDKRREQGGGASLSYANREEARIAANRLQTIDRAVDKGVIKPPNERLDVLLIAPYSRQVEELRRKLAPLKLRRLDVTVLTVDAVQGRECDLAIFTVTRSNDKGRLGFLSQPYWRRINVALSRARYGLTIIGDARFCRATPGALREVLLYADSHPDDCEVRDADHS
ncbi:AAA domain-containing protein [Nonomuraea wenchangensis]